MKTMSLEGAVFETLSRAYFEKEFRSFLDLKERGKEKMLNGNGGED